MLWDDPTSLWDQGAWDSPNPPPVTLPSNRKKSRFMASNPTPDNRDVLIALTEDILDGLDNHETSVGIKQNTKVVMSAALTAAQDTESAYATSKTLRAQKASALKNADIDGEDWLTKAAKVLRIVLGERWNTQWEATHFPNNSTEVPGTQDQRFTLLGKLKEYFTNNPAHQAPNQDVTAADATARHTALSDAREAHSQSETNQNSARNARNTAERALRKRVRAFIEELVVLLGPDDPRWDAFGLSRPSDPDTPLPASELTLSPAGPGAIYFTWKRGKRATRYRIFVKVLTVDPEFRHLDTVSELSFMHNTFTPGATVESYVVAANEAGEAAATATVSVVVG